MISKCAKRKLLIYMLLLLYSPHYLFLYQCALFASSVVSWCCFCPAFTSKATVVLLSLIIHFVVYYFTFHFSDYDEGNRCAKHNWTASHEDTMYSICFINSLVALKNVLENIVIVISFLVIIFTISKLKETVKVL